MASSLPSYTTTAIFVHDRELKTLHFVGASLRDLRRMPEDVQDAFGAALLDLQYGETLDGGRPFGEGLPREVMRIGVNDRGDTYRLAYTIASGDDVFVLDVFKKKSKRGIATPRRNLARIRGRLKSAADHAQGDPST
jgi:phage-related protein